MGGTKKGLSKSNKLWQHFLDKYRRNILIFVTVGTHEQPFDRLISKMDDLKRDQILSEDVIIQTGNTNYEPQFCKFSKMLSYDKMLENISAARIVITHGGPSSFMLSLKMGKIPIVVPRQKVYGEHINDHQLEFARNLTKLGNAILLVEDIKDLKKTILSYDKKSSNLNHSLDTNNQKFNFEFENLVKQMYEENQ
jgi:UDP-N-acetylglucosamine transferase subunit ALG13